MSVVLYVVRTSVVLPRLCFNCSVEVNGKGTLRNRGFSNYFDKENMTFRSPCIHASTRPVGSGAAWRQSPHQKSAGREREKEKKGGKKEKRGERKEKGEKGKKGREEQEM